MSDPSDLLVQFSDALAARAEAARNTVAAIAVGHGRHVTGIVWQSDVVVSSDQALPRKEEFELVGPGGTIVAATIVGRDSSTNIAVLKLKESIAAPAIAAGEARAGAVALAIGADGTGGVTARFGLVNLAGPEWHSSRGGTHRPAYRARSRPGASRGGWRCARRGGSLPRHVDLRSARSGHRHSNCNN